MSTVPERPATPRRSDFVGGALPTWIVLAAALGWAFWRVDRWADRIFARPDLGAALVAVIELGLFIAALCLAPALSRVLRFGAAPVPAAPTVVLFDGLCGLCSGFVRFALRRDRRAALRFAPLQGPAAARLLEGEPAGADDRSTVVVVVSPGTPEQRLLRRSAATLYVCEELGGAWRLAALLLLVPAFVRDFVYDRVARARHRLSGRLDACMVPDERDRARFIE